MKNSKPILPQADPAFAAGYFAATHKRLASALVGGDADDAGQVVDEMLAAQDTLSDIYLNAITPALKSVGDLWCRGEVGVGQEKLASQIIIGQMDRLRSIFSLREPRSPFRLMVACVEGEEHFIGARMVADLCAAKGWAVDFLGPNVPTDALMDMIKRRRPQVLALSLTMAQGRVHVRNLLGEIAKREPQLRVVLGGQAALEIARAASSDPGCEIAGDAVEGVAAIGRLLRADRPKAVLREYLLVLARRVRDLRTRKGWTQERLAEAAHVNRVCIVAVEGGKQNLSMDILVRLANALGVAPETLLSTDGEFGRNL